MSDVTSQSDQQAQKPRPIAASALANVRVSGGVSLSIRARGAQSYVADLSERDGYKVRLPRRSNPPEAIIINTGGGLASGDDIRQTFNVAEGAALTVTTQAAERAYRSMDNRTTHLGVHAAIAPRASFAWLPQETILFDRSRLSRTLDINVAVSSRALITETIIFGRAAMGETLSIGSFSDQWRIRRDGKLIFAENIRFHDASFATMHEAALTGGARVMTTLILVASDAEDKLDQTRAALAGTPVTCAATAWNGKLIIRGLAHRSEDVRKLNARLVPILSGLPVPRVWWT